MINPIIWITGLSGSGKTTIGNFMNKVIPNSVLLDGDILRDVLKNNKFDADSVKQNIRDIGTIALYVRSMNKVAIVCCMSAYKDSRAEIRERSLNNFVEIYLNTSVDVCEKRDPKGIYELRRKNKIQNLFGIDLAYEEGNPELILNTGDINLADCAAEILKTYFNRKNVISK